MTSTTSDDRDITVTPAGHDYETDINTVVAAAPPLSDRQRDRLSVLLRPDNTTR